MNPTAKVWHLLPHDPEAIGHLARRLNVPPLLAQLLLNRHLSDSDQAQRFLQAPLADLHEPEKLPGVVAASERLLAAVKAQKRICVWGDYDVDGVSGTAILLTCFRLLGAQVEFHVPHRLEEGYGLNCPTLRKLAQNGVNVVVTVDCGIASLAEADEARRLGLELIVTDHHEPKATLPRADVLVHPRLGDEGTTYPFRNLSGAGVAFKLAWALCKKACGSDKVPPQYREFLLDAVALAALGIVADVVPLRDENRIFVRHGLARLGKTPTLGLRSLLQTAGILGKPDLEAMDIGYSLAPRLNAAGRLGTAGLAVELLTTTDDQRATFLAQHLEQQNQQRQVLERRILGEAREMVAQDLQAPAFVLASPEWHAGLIGIVASRLVDLFHRPALLIALRPEQGAGQGSGRSVPGFPLHQALEECTEHLLTHGGHATAAGFRIVAEAIAPFRRRFQEVAQRHFGQALPPPRLVIDAEVPLAALTSGLMAGLQQLAPYGSGNPQPLLLAGDLHVVGQPRRVGGGERHLSFQVRQEGKYLRAIAFGMGERVDELMSAGGRCSVVFTPRFNLWQGMRRLEMEVRDFQPGPQARLE